MCPRNVPPHRKPKDFSRKNNRKSGKSTVDVLSSAISNRSLSSSLPFFPSFLFPFLSSPLEFPHPHKFSNERSTTTRTDFPRHDGDTFTRITFHWQRITLEAKRYRSPPPFLHIKLALLEILYSFKNKCYVQTCACFPLSPLKKDSETILFSRIILGMEKNLGRSKISLNLWSLKSLILRESRLPRKRSQPPNFPIIRPMERDGKRAWNFTSRSRDAK